MVQAFQSCLVTGMYGTAANLLPTCCLKSTGRPLPPRALLKTWHTESVQCTVAEHERALDLKSAHLDTPRLKCLSYVCDMCATSVKVDVRT